MDALERLLWLADRQIANPDMQQYALYKNTLLIILTGLTANGRVVYNTYYIIFRIVLVLCIVRPWRGGRRERHCIHSAICAIHTSYL